MATPHSTRETIPAHTQVESQSPAQDCPTLRLRQTQETAVHEDQEDKKVQWSKDTVDNEGMGKKKSKCCCIYVKPRRFVPGEPEVSSGDESSDDECAHCPGHHGKDLREPEPQDRAK
ncbi:E3 ubiquitin-protein ligase PPP1R11-like [Tigriopus californicus]|uniref:E3 ubiquitin-protein ligase PPP1R11-like n=1 Tax=Tigriopus californicus TaxID=6832 RepID=UPI0027DA80FB|nr:E3 ubiquitin-protein ligase PPP1R11-like [Tigriopus californicus]